MWTMLMQPMSAFGGLNLINWCLCWRTAWEFDKMADDRGICKHCGEKIRHFFRRSTI